ncbi:MAG: response regulator [Candidatus Delongbacteria bacterium]|nr:response regulator [Candidatus Delongbacteria bacterium]
MSKKILIIDDDPDITTAYSAFFQSRGYEVRSSYNSTKGRIEIESFQPDLIILDVMMEQPDEGFVFAQQLLDEKVRIPVIITSSIAKAGQEIFDIDIPNVKAVLQKPVDLEKLSSLVEKILLN